VVGVQDHADLVAEGSGPGAEGDSMGGPTDVLGAGLMEGAAQRRSKSWHTVDRSRESSGGFHMPTGLPGCPTGAGDDASGVRGGAGPAPEQPADPLHASPSSNLLQ
jgi:hypothetical protein